MTGLARGHQRAAPVGTSGRTGRRPADALAGTAAACMGHLRPRWPCSEETPARDRARVAVRNRRRASAGHRDGGPMRRIGICPGPRRAADIRLHSARWGQARPYGLPKAQLRKPPLKTHQPLNKTLRGGGGFAPAQPGREDSGLDGRRDENVYDARPLAGEALRGESTPAPCPRKAVQTQPLAAPNRWHRRGVQGFTRG